MHLSHIGALTMTALDPKSTALVLIDLQQGILGYELVPNTGAQLLTGGQKLAERFRAAGAAVVLVNVDFAKDGADMLRQPVDEPSGMPKGGFPAGWSEFPPGLKQPGDVVITKRQWGAFHGTELDLQLRRRGIRTIVLGGVATHIGVESTARQAHEHGYELLIVSDATSSNVAEAHAMSMKHIFPRLARVVASDAITFASR
jgi:nicotinamidase-related amidase